MKRIYQLYAVISVGFISSFVILIAFLPEPFLQFASAVQEQLALEASVFDVLNQLDGVALVYAYLSIGYLANLLVNVVMTLLAYLSENKFYFRLTLYALAINLIYFVSAIYTVRLVLETATKPLKLLQKK
jgi:hypothetical protein